MGRAEPCMVTVGAAEIDVRDMPFLPPADKVIALDLPIPISVNRTRKYDFSSQRRINEWKHRADMRIMAAGGWRRLGKLPGKFEIRIVLDETQCRLDADNAAKLLIDYCRRLELIVDDSHKYMRRVIIEWGDAPTGCRVVLRGLG